MIFINSNIPTPEIIHILGLRFRDYRMRMNLTRKEISERTGIGMTTLYRFESGNMYDISLTTIMRLLRGIGMGNNWENLIPELPESPYMYDDNDRKKQRIRHTKK